MLWLFYTNCKATPFWSNRPAPTTVCCTSWDFGGKARAGLTVWWLTSALLPAGFQIRPILTKFPQNIDKEYQVFGKLPWHVKHIDIESFWHQSRAWDWRRVTHSVIAPPLLTGSENVVGLCNQLTWRNWLYMHGNVMQVTAQCTGRMKQCVVCCLSFILLPSQEVSSWLPPSCHAAKWTFYFFTENAKANKVDGWMGLRLDGIRYLIF